MRSSTPHVTSNATVLTSSGIATVVFNHEEIDTYVTPRMNFQLTQDHRFEDVGLDLEFLESGDLPVTMAYRISAESADPQNALLTEQIAKLSDVAGLRMLKIPVRRPGQRQHHNPSSRSAVFNPGSRQCWFANTVGNDKAHSR